MTKNISITYLYRDGSNYKQNYEVVLSNPSGVSISAIKYNILHKFKDDQIFHDVIHFDPVLLYWKPLFFADHSILDSDISFHEISDIAEVDDDANTSQTIDDLLIIMRT